MHIEPWSGIEALIITIASSTLSVLLDKIKWKKTDLVRVLFKYIAWWLCWYIAFVNWLDVWIMAMATLLWWDIVMYILSKEFIDIVKWIINWYVDKL